MTSAAVDGVKADSQKATSPLSGTRFPACSAYFGYKLGARGNDGWQNHIRRKYGRVAWVLSRI